jgi:hypothetical protein
MPLAVDKWKLIRDFFYFKLWKRHHISHTIGTIVCV